MLPTQRTQVQALVGELGFYMLPRYGKQNHIKMFRDFPGGPVVKNLPAKAGDLGSIPVLEIYHMPRGS